MNIGVVNKKSFSTVDRATNETKTQSYNELIVDIPFGKRETFTLTQNKDNGNESAPQFILYWSFNQKGEKYRRVKAGALWKKVSSNGVEFYAGHIESPIFPSGRLNISVFTSKVFEGENPENITWTHEVSWTPYTPKDESSSPKTQEASRQAPTPQIDIDDDEIPF